MLERLHYHAKEGVDDENALNVRVGRSAGRLHPFREELHKVRGEDRSDMMRGREANGGKLYLTSEQVFTILGS